MVAIRAAVLSVSLLAAAPAAAQRLIEGQQLYAAKCQACHGAAATAGVGGDIRGLPLSVLARAVRGIEEMPAIALSEAELDLILAYLESLKGG